MIKIQATNLKKRYGTVEAVAGVNLEVKAGEIFGLLGPNGAGKTTTVEMLEGLRTPDGGTCLVAGLPTNSKQLPEKVGISLQAARLPAETTPHELLTLYASFYRNPLPVGDLLARFGLEEKARTRCNKLSGGQQQRLALALALIGQPEVIFLDEPTTGLDPQARRSLWEIIAGLRAEGRAILLTTHYMEEAELLCDRVAIMDHGRILAEGSPRELIDELGPERAIELELTAPPSGEALATLAALDGVTGVKHEANGVSLFTANTPRTLMAVATLLQEQTLELRDLRTRSASLEDVFISLTGRGLRD